jgi:phosphoenolpyruvate synthase/pyruvate phosphate dikinase
MGPYIIRLDEIQAKDVTLVGQKGSQLGQMEAADLPVPLGFCVTVDAYEKHIAASNLWADVQKHLTNVLVQDPAKVERISTQIQNLVLQAPMPASVRKAIETAARYLVQALGDPLTPLAVRPSAAMKGKPSADFGGQHNAFLNVIGPESLLESIKKCWASLWTARAIAFRTQNGLAHAGARMAVVVHELVSATVSGTVFTANPITGEAKEVIIDAVWGLSEAIISELVAPDNYVVRKTDLAVTDRWVSTKRVRLMPLADGGTEIQTVPSGRQATPCLSDDEIRTLVKLCLRVEDLFGGPVDIEFAWHQDHLYLLQSRPIATLFGLPTPTLEDEMAQQLRQVALLAPLDDQSIQQVARWARLQHVPADTVIIQQGEPGSDFYILASGHVTLRVEVAMGIRRFLGYRGPGFFFGETALLTGDRRNATITAVEPSEIFVFDKDSFDKLYKLHPRIEEEIRLRMEARLRLTRILTTET